MVRVMPAPKEFMRLGGLFDAASDQSKPFLMKCSEAKFLAVSDYYRASDDYIELVKEVLNTKSLGVHTNKTSCTECLFEIRTALESGQLDSEFLSALEDLRTKYLEEILKPALKKYMSKKIGKTTHLESIYLNALKIEGLIETIEFMNKVQPED